MSSTNKVAFVTGAAGNLGKPIALKLAADGFRLGLNDLPAKKGDLEKIKSEIESKGGKAFVAIADVSNEGALSKAVDSTVEALGDLSVMVANVGILTVKPILLLSTDEWDRIFSTNAKGMFVCYKVAAAKMIGTAMAKHGLPFNSPPPALREKIGDAGIGKIIGGCSVAGLMGAPFCAAYNSSKYAVRGLTQCAAMEFGAFGINVNAYAPGFIDGTKMVTDLAEGQISLVPPMFPGNTNEEKWKSFVLGSHMIKRGRFGTPADIAGLVSYLAGETGDWVHGQTWAVDGGMYMS